MQSNAQAAEQHSVSAANITFGEATNQGSAATAGSLDDYRRRNTHSLASAANLETPFYVHIYAK
jgi:LmbE family N-acetylglucosaminyl deacetylase